MNLARLLAAPIRLAAAGAACLALLAAGRADAGNAVLSKDGTLYEVFVTTYGNVVSGASAADSTLPVVALRTTPPGGAPSAEIVSGTVDAYDKYGESIEFDESTQTVFVVYSRQMGFFGDMHVAIRRDGWFEGRFIPNPGLYVSMNARLVVTRQSYLDLDANGLPVTKSRSILSVVWWEESSASQARYAAIFIEDGALILDDVVPYNLNEMAGFSGATDARGLPASSYMYPAVQRDASSNGGVFVSYANLATRTQQVLRLGFPDDFTKTGNTTTTTPTGRTTNARHTPIGRGFGESPLPTRIDLPFNQAVNTMISPAGMPTFWWTKGGNLAYLRGDSVPKPEVVVPLRPDFPLDRALAVVRDMTEKN